MKQTNRKADLPLLLLAVVLIFLIVCPVGMIFAKAVMQNGRLDFSPAVQTLLNPENAHMIGNSLLLGVLVVLLSTLIAAPLAYLFSRTKFARYRVFDILFMIPFMTPPYIASMGWILFMQKKGLLQQLVPAAAGCEKIFFTLGGLVLVMSLHVFPFMLTMLKNAMLNIPSSLEEAAADIIRRGRELQGRFAEALLTGLDRESLETFHRCLAAIDGNIDNIRRNGV